ncbi:lysophospholipid acyltransferase family protein [Novosphingobium marinum]|jgi:1-acyl-sn-glycerol-3-phosphate acyltransferase|uniref:lysophospholipid acyltransferase family protein n=1 Tax=Novosphingobium marinum TaxID=1514948 RepID=UPI000A0313D4|nr:lysophospholipid acyltransferase family protein [Novosphingobium marinum]
MAHLNPRHGSARHANGRHFHILTLRTWLFKASWVLWTLSFAPLIPVLCLSGRPPRVVRRITRLWARGTLALLAAWTGIIHRVHGDCHIALRPALILGNHQSPWETIAALVLFPDLAIVAKQELLKIPVLGWYLRYSPMVIIDRGDTTGSVRSMVTACRDALSDGRSLLIFPEGTRQPVGSPIIFKRGVELLYRTLGLPALVFVHDSGRFWPAGSVLRSGVITVSLLPPIPPGLDAREFFQQSQRMLADEVARLAG